MQIGIEFVPDKPIDKIIKWTKLAEKAGFDNVWITDHYNNRNVWATLAALALKTDKIMMGPGVTNPYHINPALIASAAVTINELSNGRALIGIGAGDKVTLNALGIKWEKPVSAVVEAIEYIRTLTDGSSYKKDGRVFSVKKAKLACVKKEPILDKDGKPVLEDGKKVKRGPKIPIYAGAQGPMMLRNTAEVADGILINASHKKDFEIAIRKIEEGAKKAGRTLNDIDISAYTAFSIGETRKDALKGDTKIVVAFIVAGSPDLVLKRHSLDMDECNRVRELLQQGNFKDLPDAVTDEMIDAFAVVGDAHQCIERIQSLEEVGVTQFIVGSPIGPDKAKAIEQVGKKIIPHFKD
ncbi:5,10-methylenetetrahydromethanopterin reductase [Candidatus Thorarchaeota archaeon]|nr:MAG: 5,10-methylenetetrahydromethanopterin reductase [Candidatus Thorarchaeota archaeon]